MGIKPWNGGATATARLVPHGLSHFRSTFSLYAKIPHPGDAKNLITMRTADWPSPPPPHRKTGPAAQRRSLVRPAVGRGGTMHPVFVPSEPSSPGGGRGFHGSSKPGFRLFARSRSRSRSPGVVHGIGDTSDYTLPFPPGPLRLSCVCRPLSVLHVHELAFGCGAGTFRPWS